MDFFSPQPLKHLIFVDVLMMAMLTLVNIAVFLMQNYFITIKIFLMLPLYGHTHPLTLHHSK